MTEKDLFLALGGIDEKIIEECAPKQDAMPKGFLYYAKRLSLAACFIIVLGAVILYTVADKFTTSPPEIPDDIGGVDSGDEDQDGSLDGGDGDIGENIIIGSNGFSICGGAAYIEFFDCYTDTECGDVLTVCISELLGISQIYFKEAVTDDFGTYRISEISSADGEFAECIDGVFVLNNVGMREMIFVNIRFENGTFENNLISREENDDYRDDESAIPESDVDNDEEVIVYNRFTSVAFDCSVVTFEGGYDRIAFRLNYAMIGNSPKKLNVGIASSLDGAMKSTEIEVLFGYCGVKPNVIIYTDTDSETQIYYCYEVGYSEIQILAKKANRNENLDYIVSSMIDLSLYNYVTTTEIKNKIDVHLYESYKNDSEYKSAYAVLSCEGENATYYYVIRLELFGDEVKYEAIEILSQMDFIYKS